MRLTALILCLALTGCATIHRHPTATKWVIAGSLGGIGAIVAAKQYHSCHSSYNGVPYNGTFPCPVYCDSPGHCDWPPKQ